MKAKIDKILKKCEQLFSACSQNIEDIQSWHNFVEIDGILNSIMEIENAEVIEIDRYDSLKDLTEWAKHEGACIDNVSIAFFPNYGYGLQANNDMNENDLILQIPRKLIFNVHTAAPELEIFKSDIILKQMPNIALALALLFERCKNSSKWNFYIKSLPRSYSTVLYMKPQDLEILKGCPSLDGAIKQIRNVARQYAYFKMILHKTKSDSLTKMKKSFTYENFRWAVSTVMTRQNMIPVKNEDKMILSLIPFWDMCNHEEGRITTNFDLSTNSCECFAMRHFKKSDQIFIHYGSRTNTEFFIHSGFLPENNHNDSFRLRLGISPLDPLKEQRIYLLNKLGLPINHEYTLQPGNEVMSGSLLAFLRIFHFSKSELIKWMNSENVCMLTESSCDTSNDIHCKAMSYIKVRLELLIQRYKSINEETFLNEIQDMPLTRQLVWKMKLSEKNLMKNILSDIPISKDDN